MTQRIGRLNRLLEDLLEYSRIGKDSGKLSTVSVVRTVNDTSEMLDPAGNFDVELVAEEDEIETFPAPLRQVLLNLVNNAIKHHDSTSGRIIIRTRLNLGRAEFQVEDDGPGIDPQFHEKIFVIFQTLRSRDEVEGSGLGLAIIRKLIEHHGGTIRVTSNPSVCRGTTFHFDLPGEETTKVGTLQNHAA